MAELGERRRYVGGQRADIGARQLRVGAAGLDAGEVEQRVDQALQAPGVAARRAQPIRQHTSRCRFGQRIVERPEQQRQRGAELVADVGQERRFRPVQIGQRVGPAPLLFVGDGGGKRRGQLVRQQLAEPAVHRIEGTPRIRPDHHRPGGRGFPKGQYQGLPGTVLAEKFCDARDYVPKPVDDACGPGTWRGVPARELGQRTRQQRTDGGRGPAQRAVARPLPVARHVHGDERQVQRLRVADRDGAAHRVVDGVRVHHRGRHRVEQVEPTLAQHPVGRFDHRAENGGDRAIAADDGAIGESEVPLLGLAAGHERQHQVVGPGRDAGVHHAGEHRGNLLPDLPPHLLRAATQGRRMFVPQNLRVGVVVHQEQIPGPQPEHDGKPRGQSDRHRRPHLGRPLLRRAQRMGLPVEFGESAAHLPAQPDRGRQIGRQRRVHCWRLCCSASDSVG